MKKKILAMSLCVVMLAIAIVGGTLAYFTDTKTATNTFTVGGVKIELIEQQRKVDENGDKTTELENFEQNKVLMPIVGSAQTGPKDSLGLPLAENYVDKIITIENTGKSDAWVRAYFAIPSALDDGADTYNAGLNILHFNFGNKIVNGNVYTTYGDEWSWKTGDAWNCINQYDINGVKYNIYYADYSQVLPADKTTVQFVSGVYLDKSFDQKDGKYYAFGKEVDLSGLISDNGELVVNCPVKAVAVQAAGFNNAAEAVTAAFGANFNPWAAE